ncbi:MAG: hypothetical protein QF685_07900 [Verrucomicrobiota bacterium]|nr:hypothetical protein [Verrucomicrobiota bacterium]
MCVSVILLRPAEQQAVEQQAVEQQAVEQQAVEQQAVEQQAVEQQAVEQQAVEQRAVEQRAVVGQLQFSRSGVLGVQAAMVEWFLAALVVRPAEVCQIRVVVAPAAVCQTRVVVAAAEVCQTRVAVAPVDRVVQETLLSQWECRLLHPDRRDIFSSCHLPRTLLFKRRLLMVV